MERWTEAERAAKAEDEALAYIVAGFAARACGCDGTSDMTAPGDRSTVDLATRAVRALVRRIDAERPEVAKWMDRIQGAVAKLQAAETQHAGKAETKTALTMANLRASKHATRLESLETRLAAIDRTVSAQGQRIGALEGLLSAEAMRRAAAATRPAPSSPELEERRARVAPVAPEAKRPEWVRIVKSESPSRFKDGDVLRVVKWVDEVPAVDVDGYDVSGYVLYDSKWAPAPCPPPVAAPDFLTPPPIARAIGRAVMAAAEKIGGPQAMIDAHAKVKAAATLRERLLGILDLIGGEAFDRLNHAIVDAQRAGVIP